jgi:cytoskeletal protein CcmA (bactofilin family)
VFTAGGAINVIGATAPSMFVAGGSVSLSGVTVEDVIAAGGDVEISGTISDDVIAAGGRVTLRQGTIVGEDAILAGGQITLDGEIAGDLVVNGGQVVLGAQVGGNVTVNASSITVLTGARIDGDLTYSSPDELDVPDSVVITGTLTRKEWDGWQTDFGGGELAAIGVGFWLSTLLAQLVLALGLTAVFPHSIGRMAESVSVNPFQSLGIGFAALLGIPAASFLLIATLVGSLFGIFSILLFLLSLVFAYVVACLWIGLMVRSRTQDSGTALTLRGRLKWLTVGVLIFALIGLVPFLGTVARILAVLTGLGAMLSTVWKDRQVSQPPTSE